MVAVDSINNSKVGSNDTALGESKPVLGSLSETQTNTHTTRQDGSKKKIIIGVFQRNEKGYGFVVPENQSKENDVFIEPRNIKGALNEDIVEVEILKETPKSREGKIIRIVRRKTVGNLKEKVIYINKDNKYCELTLTIVVYRNV